MSDKKTPSVVTMNDVARVAGLSRTTVSKYFNGAKTLKPATRELIARTCAELDYVPDWHAVSLVKGVSPLIGVVLPIIADAFYGEVLRHMEDQAQATGSQLVILCSHNDAAVEQAALQTLRSMKVQGLVVSAVASDHNQAFFERLAQDTRLVFLDSYVQPECNFVMNDNRQSLGLLVEHLLERGQAPAYLGAPAVARPSHDERLQGYVEAMEAAGHAPCVIPISEAPSWDFEAFAQTHVSRWLSEAGGKNAQIGALICATDRLALGAMRAYRRHGRKPGEDILIAGHDDVPMCEYIHPSLTTARQDLEAIGRAAIECLHGETGGGFYQRRIPAKLVIRESSGPIKA